MTLILAYALGLCACFVLAAPLYASDQSGHEGNQTMSAMIGKQSPLVTNQMQTAAQKTKQHVAAKEKSKEKVISVDFKQLKERLKDTDAIGFFTKLAIRNDIVDLMDKIKKYRKSSMLQTKIKEIRSNFDGLLLKIIALLEGDPGLSRDLYVGRESIWESLLEVKA